LPDEPFKVPAMKLPRVLSSIRALVALVLAIGGGLGWFVHRAQVQRDAVAAILRAGGRVSYDWQWNNGRRTAQGKLRWPGWLVNRLGPDYFADVTRVDLAAGGTDEVLVYVGRLSRLQSLNAMAPTVTDSGMAHLDGLTRLQSLTLAYTQVSDVSLPHLKRLTGLRELGLWQSKVSEIGLDELRQAMPSTSVDPPPWPKEARVAPFVPASAAR
jgi:hypothetical protein